MPQTKVILRYFFKSRMYTSRFRPARDGFCALILLGFNSSFLRWGTGDHSAVWLGKGLFPSSHWSLIKFIPLRVWNSWALASASPTREEVSSVSFHPTRALHQVITIPCYLNMFCFFHPKGRMSCRAVNTARKNDRGYLPCTLILFKSGRGRGCRVSGLLAIYYVASTL